MKLSISAEEEAYLNEIARHAGRTPVEILTAAALSLFDSDRRFRGVMQGKVIEGHRVERAGAEVEPVMTELPEDWLAGGQNTH